MVNDDDDNNSNYVPSDNEDQGSACEDDDDNDYNPTNNDNHSESSNVTDPGNMIMTLMGRKTQE